MITWRYANGELTWQACLLISCVSFFLVCIGAVLADRWERRREKEFRRAWRRGRIEADSRCSLTLFRNQHRR